MSIANERRLRVGCSSGAISGQPPVRRAAAAVIQASDGRVLLVQRNNLVDEFKGVWSFPSTFIDDSLPDENIPLFLRSRLVSWLGLQVGELTLIVQRVGLRPLWQLRMYIYLTEPLSVPVIQTPKYDALQWVDGHAYFSQFKWEMMGDCAKGYLEYLGCCLS